MAEIRLPDYEGVDVANIVDDVDTLADADTTANIADIHASASTQQPICSISHRNMFDFLYESVCAIDGRLTNIAIAVDSAKAECRAVHVNYKKTTLAEEDLIISELSDAHDSIIKSHLECIERYKYNAAVAIHIARDSMEWTKCRIRAMYSIIHNTLQGINDSIADSNQMTQPEQYYIHNYGKYIVDLFIAICKQYIKSQHELHACAGMNTTPFSIKL